MYDDDSKMQISVCSANGGIQDGVVTVRIRSRSDNDERESGDNERK